MADRKANAYFRFALALAGVLVVPAIQAEDGEKKPEISHAFRIEMVDDETGRGVPLVELRTVNQIRYLTDSNGTSPGGSARIKIKRLNIARRLYRVTGAGIYRDSLQQAGPELYYSPVEDPRPGFQRTDRPVGLVWRNPSRLRIW